MTIINKTTKAVETQPWRKENWLGDEWIEVPDNLVADAYANAGYFELEIVGGVLIAIIPTARPEPEAIIRELAPDEQRDLLLAQLLENQLLMLNGMNDLVKI